MSRTLPTPSIRLQWSRHGGAVDLPAGRQAKEGKDAVKWTRLSCHDFLDNPVRLQLFALAYNLGNFLRRLALPRSVKHPYAGRFGLHHGMATAGYPLRRAERMLAGLAIGDRLVTKADGSRRPIAIRGIPVDSTSRPGGGQAMG